MHELIDQETKKIILLTLEHYKKVYKLDSLGEETIVKMLNTVFMEGINVGATSVVNIVNGKVSAEEMRQKVNEEGEKN